jgi:hypothetical protein
MRAFAGFLLVAIVAALGYFGWTHWSVRREVEASPGVASGALVVPLQGGAVVVVADRVGTNSRGGVYRFTAIDPQTGAALGERTLDEPSSCWPGSPGRMWCESARGDVHLVAVPSFELAAAAPGDDASRDLHGRLERTCAFADSIPSAGGHLTFGTGTTRRPLVRHADHEEGKEPTSYSLPGVPDFLSPSFLRVEDDALLLVQHDASLERPGALQLSRVDPDLHLTWTADLAGPCESAHVVEGRLIVTSPDAATRALALDVATGKVLWRYGR